MSNKKHKKKSTAGRIVSTLVLAAALVVFCYAAYRLYDIFHNYNAAQSEYEELAETYTAPNDTPSEEGEEETALVVDEEEKAPIKVDFKKLKAINSDIVGWLWVDACPNISYPILHGEDNEFYLHHTFEKQPVYSASIFVNCDNAGDFSDSNTIVFGHRMSDGSMFGTLKDLRDQETVEKDPYFWILTPDGNYRYQIFSVMEANAFGDAYTVFREPSHFFLEWAEKMKAASMVDLDVELSEDDHIVMLSTCTDDASVRLVVMGKCISEKQPAAKEKKPAEEVAVENEAVEETDVTE